MYDVSWSDAATRSLLAQIAAASEEMRDAAIAASLSVEARLKGDPTTAGESREPGTRVLIENPITVTFHINEFERTVAISAARLHRR